MNFSENTTLTPGGTSASPTKVKELENRIDDLQQTVTTVADSVSDLANEVTTAELNATSASITNAVVDSATVGTETATTVNADTVNADNLNATDANITNLISDDIDANTVDADNGYFGSANAQSFTGQGVNITGDITASNKVQGKTVQATEKVVTPALESTETELKGETTVRGDVYFPESGDKIYGEYLEVDADKVKVKNLTTETPTDTNQIVGYDNNGNLIPVDASLDPASLWESSSSDTIRPKNNKKILVKGATVDGDLSVSEDLTVEDDLYVEDTLSVSEDATVSGELTVGGSATVTGTLSVTNDATLAEALTVAGDTTVNDLTVSGEASVGGQLSCLSISSTGSIITNANLAAGGDLIISGNAGVIGDTNLTDTTIDGTLTVNGDIIQNGSAYETHAEKLYTKKDIIITRDGAVSALGTDEYTGIQATKYDGTNDGQLVFDKDGEARVGDVGDTQPLLTRDEAADLTDGNPLVWDATNKKAVSGTVADTVASGNTNPVTSGAVFSANAVITASSTTLTGAPISSGSVIRVMFTSAITGSDTSTVMSITYNGTAYPVKVGKNGALSNFVASYVDNAYTYLQAYTTLELAFDGTQFIILGNPVVLSSSDYTIYADGSIDSDINLIESWTNEVIEGNTSGSTFAEIGAYTPSVDTTVCVTVWQEETLTSNTRNSLCFLSVSSNIYESGVINGNLSRGFRKWIVRLPAGYTYKLNYWTYDLSSASKYSNFKIIPLR